MNALEKLAAKQHLTDQLVKQAKMAGLMEALKGLGPKFMALSPAGKAGAAAAGLGGAGLLAMGAKKLLTRPTAGQAAMKFISKHKVPLAVGGAGGLGLAAMMGSRR